MNSIQYANYINEMAANGGNKQIISDDLIKKMEGFMQNPYSAEFPGINANALGTDWASSRDAVYANTDWFDFYLKMLLSVIHTI